MKRNQSSKSNVPAKKRKEYNSDSSLEGLVNQGFVDSDSDKDHADSQTHSDPCIMFPNDILHTIFEFSKYYTVVTTFSLVCKDWLQATIDLPPTKKNSLRFLELDNPLSIMFGGRHGKDEKGAYKRLMNSGRLNNVYEVEISAGSTLAQEFVSKYLPKLASVRSLVSSTPFSINETKIPKKIIRSQLLIDLLKGDLTRETITHNEGDWLQTKGFIVMCCNVFHPTTIFTFTNRVFNRDENGKPLSQWPTILKDHLLIEELEQNSTHCISNSFLNDHLWQKVKVLRESMEQCYEHVRNDMSPKDIVSMFSKLLNVRNINKYQNNDVCVDDFELFTDTFMVTHNFDPEIVELVHNYQKGNYSDKFLMERKIDAYLYDRSTINDIFVHYKSKFTNWKTKSQSIIILDALVRKVYFFFRDVNELSFITQEENDRLEWICKEIEMKEQM